MADEKQDVIESVVKALAIVEGLAGREYEPVSLAELAEKSRQDKAGIYLILKTLEVCGYAEQSEEKGWRLTPRFIRLSEEYRIGMTKFIKRVDEKNRNYLGQF